MTDDIIDKITECLQMVSEDFRGYYNVETGEILWISELGGLGEEKLNELEDNPDNYISLPTRYDIDEYSMMDEFAYQYPDAVISNKLREDLCGRGAFRRFKDSVFRFGIREEWFKYRDEKYRELAEEWCVRNGLVKPRTPKILLTAFKGTSSEKVIGCFNEAYRRLILENDKVISVNQLISELENDRFDYVISFGQKPVIKDKIYVECSGRLGDTEYETDFDIIRLVSALKHNEFSVHISNNAGTSYCNNLYARGLKIILERAYKGRMVFIHIPFEKNISDLNDFSDRLIKAIQELEK
ncbi:MAG: hypothetical protein J5997_04040 [Oscillospiraceae bacterium]|nr:hypothetical protein [Oscillospiraceae bacterium]